MKKKLFLLLVCSLTALYSVSQNSGTCGENLTWSFDRETETLTISGTGEMADYLITSYSEIPWYAIRTQIMRVKIEDGVTSIGNCTFYGCINLISMQISNSVTRIGYFAFIWCAGLSSVTIPKSVTEIGVYTFYGCTGLLSIEAENTNPSYASEDGILFDKEKNTLIFCPAGKAGSLTIPNGVTKIGNYAFSECAGLVSISIPNSVTHIGYSAFYGCTGLSSIIIPNSVTTIENYAFSDCTGLASIHISNNVTRIGDWTFSNCYDLASIDIPNGVTSIGNFTFSNCIGLTSITLPNTMASMGDGVFEYCIGLTSITLHNILTNIGDGTFSGCSDLISINIPESVASIGDYAFYQCSSLTSITLPNSLTSIGDYSFYQCSSLTSIINWNPVPVDLDDSVFHEVDKTACILSVPEGAVDLYQQAEVWGEFQVMAIKGTNIQEIPVINAIQIYPNPVAASFRIRGIEENTMVTVWDLSGRMVLQQIVNPAEAIEVANLPKGLYLVNVMGKTGRLMKK